MTNPAHGIRLDFSVRPNENDLCETNTQHPAAEAPLPRPECFFRESDPSALFFCPAAGGAASLSISPVSWRAAEALFFCPARTFSRVPGSFNLTENTMRLPGLIDVHTHIREPGATHKEDWRSGTAAALAGGSRWSWPCPILSRPITDASTLNTALAAGRAGLAVITPSTWGPGPDNVESAAAWPPGCGTQDVPRPDLWPAAP